MSFSGNRSPKPTTSKTGRQHESRTVWAQDRLVRLLDNDGHLSIPEALQGRCARPARTLVEANDVPACPPEKRSPSTPGIRRPPRPR
jgi:hypothetical protein